MGNCIGPRSIRDPKEEKRNAPKTPKKGDSIKTVATTPGNGQMKETTKNGNTIEGSEKDNDIKDTRDAATKFDGSDDKVGEVEGSGVPAAEKLSTSWVVFDESDDEKLRRNPRTSKTEDGQTSNMATNKNIDDISSSQPESGVQVDVKEEKSIQKLGNVEKQDKEGLKNQEDTSPVAKAAGNAGLDTVESTGNQDSKGEEPKGVNDATKKEVKAEVDRPGDAGQVNDTKNSDTKPPVDTGSSADGSSAETGKPDSINVVHNVENGRLVVTKKTTKEITPNRNGEKEETEEEKTQKRLDVLKSKMENFASLHKYFDNVIDFETMLFKDEVLNRKVVLEDIFISGREISGLIATSIGDQHPKAIVRYTTNSWKSTLDEESITFTADGDSSETVQRFFFSLFVPFEKSIEFAVNSMGPCGDIWDNNSGTNYRIDNMEGNGGLGGLIEKFTPLKRALFKDFVRRKSVALKSASLKDGTVTLKIATKDKCNEPPVVRYTLDDWKSSTDVTSVESRGKDASQNISEIQLDIARQAKLKFAIFWRHEGIEYWDNNDGMNFEIQC